jgi:Tfp pilus assembly protein PilX
MSLARARGATLVVGLILLSLVTMLGLAGASTAHVEQQLAQNEQFRDAAAAAASAGIEVAIARIAVAESPSSVPRSLRESMPGTTDRIDVAIRFVGYETALPQAPGGDLTGAHFEIVSTGFSARRAVDRQRADVMHVVHAADAEPQICGDEAAGRHCYTAGEMARLAWQRVNVE